MKSTILARPRGGALAVAVLLAAAGALPAAAGVPALRCSPDAGIVHGGATSSAAKVETDTVLVLGPWGSGAPYNGQFQSPGGGADWNGWTGVDLTYSADPHWHADTNGALAGSWSAWCGTLAYPACGPEDPAGGYGHGWDESLEWRGTVADPAASCTVDVSATVQADTEPGYDYAYVSVVKGGAVSDLWVGEGTVAAAPLALQTIYTPLDYEGPDGDQVVVQFRFTSDGAWDDADCSWPTDGAFRVDDLAITLSNGAGYAHDFEDGTLGALQVVVPPSVGNFAAVRTVPQTPFLCGRANTSPLATFVDDGLVVPGTGGTACQTWCYGPQGWVLNHTGGLAGPDEHLHNAVESPVMAWPGPGHEGALLEFDVWRHNVFAFEYAGIFFTWSVRSTTSPDAAEIAAAPWRDRNFFYEGGPAWLRMVEPVSDLVPADAQWVQVQLAAYEIGWAWGISGDEGTPAPYFDNVRLAAFPQHGPDISAAVLDLPHDTFPEGGVLDLVNLGANTVRFDAGRNTAGWGETHIIPGDSVVVTVVPVREGAVLVGVPRLHWSLRRNPLFDPYRTAGLPDQGSLEGWPAVSNGTPALNRFAFDLPDTGFLFPGDILHCYFSATDEAGGVQQTVTLPADTSGFSDFADPMAYPPIYELRALPTLSGSPGAVEQPSILFWDDAGAEGNRDEWYLAFRNLGLFAGLDYDVYYTSDPRRGDGNGLGGRATAAQLAGYRDLLYTCGKMENLTLVDGNAGLHGDASPDLQVLVAWLEQGGKDVFLTGDDLAGNLSRLGSIEANGFLADWMGVDVAADNVLEEIGGQITPLVAAAPLNPVLVRLAQWRDVAECSVTSLYYGGGTTATGHRRVDGVVPRAGAVLLAEFTDPTGATGQYAFSAATLHEVPAHDASVISLPIDLRGVWTADDAVKAGATIAARARLLEDVLSYFGYAGIGWPLAVPEAGLLSARSHPNPFNPATTIGWSLPRAGDLDVAIYDVRGRHVRTLVSGPAAAGPGEVRWDGRTAGGEAAAAGVYFYRLRADGETLVGKMALIK